jgi:hypothetical protein
MRIFYATDYFFSFFGNNICPILGKNDKNLVIYDENSCLFGEKW